MAIISTAKLYEVQKFCSMTNHMWDGFWFLANKKSFERLPKDLQEIVTRNVNEAGMKQRVDVKALNDSLATEMKSKGLQFNDTDNEAFRTNCAAPVSTPNGTRSSVKSLGPCWRNTPGSWHKWKRR